MKKPGIGEVFVAPRGREYEVIGHMLDPRRIVVREGSSGICDTAVWELMTKEHGWSPKPTASVGNTYGIPKLDGINGVEAVPAARTETPRVLRFDDAISIAVSKRTEYEEIEDHRAINVIDAVIVGMRAALLKASQTGGGE